MSRLQITAALLLELDSRNNKNSRNRQPLMLKHLLQQKTTKPVQWHEALFFTCISPMLT